MHEDFPWEELLMPFYLRAYLLNWGSNELIFSLQSLGKEEETQLYLHGSSNKL